MLTININEKECSVDIYAHVKRPKTRETLILHCMQPILLENCQVTCEL